MSDAIRIIRSCPIASRHQVTWGHWKTGRQGAEGHHLVGAERQPPRPVTRSGLRVLKKPHPVEDRYQPVLVEQTGNETICSNPVGDMYQPVPAWTYRQ